MFPFKDRDDHATCPIMQSGLTKEQARRAAEHCTAACRFREHGACQCRIVDMPTKAGQRSA